MTSLADLLSWMDNKRRVVGRNLSDLVQNPAAVVDQWDDQAKGFNRNTEPVIQGDQLSNRPMTEDQIRQKYTDLALNAPMGAMTAWHGSPHKFDKFSLDRIGTGEGAQAYGHGLYLAESPEVAKSYAENLANRSVSPSDLVSINGKSLKEVMASAPPMARAKVTSHIVNAGGDVALAQKTLDEFVEKWKDKATLNGQSDLAYAQQWMKQLADRNITFKPKPAGELYKTDIPDEAVARFLDWDKPLSQQAEAMSVFRNAGVDVDKEMLSNLGEIIKKQKGLPYASSPPDIQGIMGRLVKKLGSKDAANEYLVQKGIPGIRYLDGGSRSAGQGSSNFVAFDPEMIRILERNGQATGLQPWQPGEYRPMSDLITPRTD
jgi:hypothetical protein